MKNGEVLFGRLCLVIVAAICIFQACNPYEDYPDWLRVGVMMLGLIVAGLGYLTVRKTE